MRPLKKMEHYYELDKQIVSFYTRVVNRKHQAEKAVSIDANRTAYSDQSNTMEDASHAGDPAVMGA